MAEPLGDLELRQIKAWLSDEQPHESDVATLALTAGRRLLATMQRDDDEVIALLDRIRKYNAFRQFGHDVQDQLNQLWTERQRRYDLHWLEAQKETP